MKPSRLFISVLMGSLLISGYRWSWQKDEAAVVPEASGAAQKKSSVPAVKKKPAPVRKAADKKGRPNGTVVAVKPSRAGSSSAAKKTAADEGMSKKIESQLQTAFAANERANQQKDNGFIQLQTLVNQAQRHQQILAFHNRLQQNRDRQAVIQNASKVLNTIHVRQSLGAVGFNRVPWTNAPRQPTPPVALDSQNKSDMAKNRTPSAFDSSLKPMGKV